MTVLTDRENCLLQEALKYFIDKKYDYNHERERLLSKIEGLRKTGLLPTVELQRMLSNREGCESLIVSAHTNRQIELRGPCTVTINRD